MYKEDWLGLKALDTQGRLQFLDMAGDHMQFQWEFFIDQIVAVEPQFYELTKVRPGITSWGQVKYGYAENVEQMIDRMKFDLLYLKNRTLSLDIKIMLYTIAIVFKGSGK